MEVNVTDLGYIGDEEDVRYKLGPAIPGVRPTAENQV